MLFWAEPLSLSPSAYPLKAIIALPVRQPNIKSRRDDEDCNQHIYLFNWGDCL